MKKLSLLLSIVIVTVFSCKKDTIEPIIDTETGTNTPTGSTGGISNFFKQNVLNATQTFTIDASTYEYITGSKGTKLYINANTFKDQFNNIVTGNVTIELIEIQTKADMILLNKTTTSNGNLLISGGEISVKAFQNGSQLMLATNAYIGVNMPTNNPVNMQLFTGTEDDNGNLNWDSTGTNVIVDTLGGFNFNLDSLTLNNDSLGWINCDYFYGQGNLTTLNVITSSPYNGANTFIYLFFNNIYSVAPLSWSNNTQNFVSYSNSLPVGSQMTIVAISEINGQYYSSFTPITLTTNHSETINLNATTLSALEIDLNNL